MAGRNHRNFYTDLDTRPQRFGIVGPITENHGGIAASRDGGTELMREMVVLERELQETLRTGRRTELAVSSGY